MYKQYRHVLMLFLLSATAAEPVFSAVGLENPVPVRSHSSANVVQEALSPRGAMESSSLNRTLNIDFVQAIKQVIESGLDEPQTRRGFLFTLAAALPTLAAVLTAPRRVMAGELPSEDATTKAVRDRILKVAKSAAKAMEFRQQKQENTPVSLRERDAIRALNTLDRSRIVVDVSPLNWNNFIRMDKDNTHMIIVADSLGKVSDEELETVIIHEIIHMLPVQQARRRRIVVISTRDVSDISSNLRQRALLKEFVRLTVDNEIEAVEVQWRDWRARASLKGMRIQDYLKFTALYTQSPEMRKAKNNFLTLLTDDGQLSIDNLRLSLVLNSDIFSAEQRKFLPKLAIAENLALRRPSIVAAEETGKLEPLQYDQEFCAWLLGWLGSSADTSQKKTGVQHSSLQNKRPQTATAA